MKRREFMKMLAICAVACNAGGLPALSAYAKSLNQEDLDLLKGAPRYKVCDAHFHYVDFLQHTDGIAPLLQAMNANGVEHIAFWGMPLVKKWDKGDPKAPNYYLDDNSRAYWYSATDFLVARAYLSVPKKQRHRFHPFLCGFNCTDKYAVDHVKRMLNAFPGMWQGIGEILAHRDDLTNLTYGETARANHEALSLVYDLAAENDLPINLHNNCTSRGSLEELLYVYEVEDALKNHPKTRITWAHAGLSRYLDVDLGKYVKMLDVMLDKYANLTIDLSWLIYEHYVTRGLPELAVRSCWLDIVEAYPDRFMIGTDCVGHYKNYPFNIRKYYTMLDALTPETAQKVARENFLSILPATVRNNMPADALV
jgi:hypothetical protein